MSTNLTENSATFVLLFYGHSTGDEILKKVADRLKRAFRTIDYVCRIGGDEFAIIMVEMVTVFINKLTEICYTKAIEIANEDGVFAVALVGGRKEAALWRTIFL